MIAISLFLQILIDFIINTYIIGKKAISKFNLISSIIAIFLLSFLYGVIGFYSSIIMFLCLILINYKVLSKWSESIYIGGITMITTILADYITSFVLYSGYILSLPLVNSAYPTLTSLIIHLGSFFIISMFLGKIWRMIIKKIDSVKDNFKNLKLILAILSSFTYLCYFLSISLVRALGNENKIIALNGFFLSIYFLIFLICLVALLNYQKKKYEIEKKEFEFQNLQIYTDKLEESYTEMRKFRHDYINILASMSEYIVNKDIEALDNYFNENIMNVSDSIKLNNFKLSYLKNIKIPEIKGLLSSKLIMGQEKGIDITFEALDVIDKIYMDSVDFCRCLGILLDNAIEETTNISNSKINVAFINNKSSISFVVMNSYVDKGYKVFNYFEKGFSTKGKNRGFGLSNLREIIDKSRNAELDTNMENGNFIQEIKINKGEDD